MHDHQSILVGKEAQLVLQHVHHELFPSNLLLDEFNKLQITSYGVANQDT